MIEDPKLRRVINREGINITEWYERYLALEARIDKSPRVTQHEVKLLKIRLAKLESELEAVAEILMEDVTYVPSEQPPLPGL